VVVAMQADPGFEVASAGRVSGTWTGSTTSSPPSSPRPGRSPSRSSSSTDSHVQRTDTPLVDLATGQPVPNVTRVETFGSPKVGWVEITLDPAGASFVEAKARPVSVPD
jgi:hypothetical protein